MAQQDRTINIRAALLLLGATLGVIGMTSEIDWLVWAAIGVLAIGGILAIYRRTKRE